MPNKKVKKKSAKPKKAAAKKGRRPVNKTLQKKLVKKKAVPKKTVPKKKKAAVKTKSPVKKKASSKTASVNRARIPLESPDRDSEVLTRLSRRPRPAGQSGDLQGLSRAESADSESVDELIEEGNAFEADVVAGVQRADNEDEKEVRTHEVPEDDVPEEYLDKD